MADSELQITSQPEERDWQAIEAEIDRFNIRTTGYDDYLTLAIFVRDDAGSLVAGLTGFTWGGTLRVQYLWVHEDRRRHGYGSRLLVAAEEEARKRGCRQAVLDTHSFQAPEFYPARGYTVCGVMDDNPVGYRQIVFQKQLTD